MKKLTKEDLKKIYIYATSANLDLYTDLLSTQMESAGIDTPLRKAAFLAQIGHESGQLRYVEELESGKAYEGRKDLGNTEVGDGVRFKGRGLIQITGRANYTAIAKDLGINCVDYPEVLEEPENAVAVSIWFWNKKRLNTFADIPDFEKITRIINGGLNGYADRLALYEKAKKVL
jgi:putative chitinase